MCGNQSNTNTNNVAIQLAKSPIEISDSAAKISKLPKEYEKIGNRYFYIDKGKFVYSWFSAFNQCRQMGGQLATIESEEELTAIVGKLSAWGYWLGVTNLANRNVYTSVASGKKVNFVHWAELQPDKQNIENCICLYTKLMHDYPCDSTMRFICEAED
ncbi:hypothetical protein KR059_010404 [Drosophila kikkawai]|nr:hypothetical protein KR059_010404 [Drosophila kikkawai]